MSRPTIQIKGYLQPGTYVGKSSGAFAPISTPMKIPSNTNPFSSTPSLPPPSLPPRPPIIELGLAALEFSNITIESAYELARLQITSISDPASGDDLARLILSIIGG